MNDIPGSDGGNVDIRPDWEYFKPIPSNYFRIRIQTLESLFNKNI